MVVELGIDKGTKAATQDLGVKFYTGFRAHTYAAFAETDSLYGCLALKAAWTHCIRSACRGVAGDIQDWKVDCS